ncbi:MAG: KAP family NTPase, partial [Desulfovibrionaceae bacterium]|nr:KAP family NTPase [Desulfovibrionaceae bacterium]
MNNIEDARFGEEDLLYRKGIAEKLIKLFRGENNFSPIILDGVWGSGKSFFCHQLKNLILDEEKSEQEEKKKLQVSYVNAFQFDYT